jgi:PEP-CTERM motif
LKTTLFALGLFLVASTRVDASTIFTQTRGTDTLVTDPDSLDLNWNFQNLPGWNNVYQILSVTFDLRLRDDDRSNPFEGFERFRYVLVSPGPAPNYRIMGDPNILFPNTAGNTDYSATPFDGQTSSNGGVLNFSDLLSGQFTTRVNATLGDFEFRRATITIDAQTVPEPGTFVLGAGALAALAWFRKKSVRKA